MSKNNEKIDFTKISQKIHQTDFIDGFAVIFIGLIVIVLAGIIEFNFSLGPLIVVIVTELFRPSVSKALRERYTYPRIGHFKIKTNQTSKDVVRILLFMIVIFTVSFIIFLYIEGGNVDELYSKIWKYLLITFGLLMFGPSIDLVNRTGQNEFYGIGILSTLLGIFIFFLDLPQQKEGFIIYLTILGVSFILIGFFLFFRFIQTYPLISDEEEPVEKELER
ncbi:MAG: hypothetical protein ACW97P_04410 [Candidatus Hodarchaeales archaeon]|jgi:hypothetical protein